MCEEERKLPLSEQSKVGAAVIKVNCTDADENVSSNIVSLDMF